MVLRVLLNIEDILFSILRASIASHMELHQVFSHWESGGHFVTAVSLSYSDSCAKILAHFSNQVKLNVKT